MIQRLSKIEGIHTNHPEGAFYIFPDVSELFGRNYNGSTLKGSNDVSEFLLEEALVATVAGEAFGNDNCIRLSYAASEDELNQAMDRIQKAIEKLD